jgi:NAD(P)-dependent dehydrogenase (short-subunit alcohol dehydrogenase family)
VTGRLDRRVAVVVGGHSGLGAAVARTFADDGATVVVAGRRSEPVGAAAAALGGLGVTCDVTDDDQVQAMVATTLAECGGLDVAVNCAGHQESTPLRALTPEKLRSMVEVQLVGALFVLRHCCNAMAERGGGAYLSVSSLTAQNPAEGLAAYASSKKGLEYATRIAAVEYGPSGVRVNCVAPHLIDTPMTASIFERPGVVDAMLAETPLRRMGTPDDVARAALFLCSDDAGYISGQTLCVDGGASTRRLPTADEIIRSAQAASSR